MSDLLESLEEVAQLIRAKHQPGQHDQSKHAGSRGKKGGGGGGLKTPPGAGGSKSPDKIKAGLAKVKVPHEPEGWTALESQKLGKKGVSTEKRVGKKLRTAAITKDWHSPDGLWTLSMSESAGGKGRDHTQHSGDYDKMVKAGNKFIETGHMW